MPRQVPPPVQMPLRVTHKLRMALNALAVRENVSLNALCTRILEEHLERAT